MAWDFWKPETDKQTLKYIGKLSEELHELGKAIARIQIQGMDGVDPETGKSNRTALFEELADAHALVRLNVGFFFPDKLPEFYDRETRKTIRLKAWLDDLNTNR